MSTHVGTVGGAGVVGTGTLVHWQRGSPFLLSRQLLHHCWPASAEGAQQENACRLGAAAEDTEDIRKQKLKILTIILKS